MTALIGPNMRLPSATGRAPPGRKSTWGSTTTRASCGPTAIGLIALRIADMNPSFTTPSSSSGKHRVRGAENTLAGSADERADSTDRYRTDRTGARRAARGRRARRDRRAGGSRRGQRRDPPRRRAPAGGGDRAQLESDGKDDESGDRAIDEEAADQAPHEPGRPEDEIVDAEQRRPLSPVEIGCNEGEEERVLQRGPDAPERRAGFRRRPATEERQRRRGRGDHERNTDDRCSQPVEEPSENR